MKKIAGLLILSSIAWGQEKPFEHPLNTWVKRTPLEGTPTSPRLGYEGDCVWDPKHHVMLRYGGHNQGGGGEQHSDVWTFDPYTAKWALKEPNTAPPGVCCAQQNVFDPIASRYLRFPSFSGSHGWQWSREIYMNQTAVWTYDLETNLWRNRRPYPAPKLSPLRCASWDSDREVVVVFGGEGSQEGTIVYDPYLNTWTSMKPAKQPDFRSGGNMTYDAERKLHILFGSQFSNDPHTWAYDLAKNEWRDLKPETQPPTDKNDAVLVYDAVGKVVIAIVKVTEGKDEEAKSSVQTWAFDAGKNAWARMNPAREPDAAGNRTRVLLAVPERNVVFLENCTSKPREQQVWSYRYAEGKAQAIAAKPKNRPRAPEDLVVSVISEKEVDLRWKGEGASFAVERAPVEVLTEDQLKRLKSRTPPLAEPSVGAFKAVGKFQKLGSTTDASWVDREVSLSKAVTVAGADAVWSREFSAKEERDEAGKAYPLGVYAYRIRAINAQGVESGPSEAVFTIPSMPQWVFSKEEGATCHVKWAANPERGIRGYRVYRMDGRFDKEPITRLTADPISETKFSDPSAGKSSRRYYIVAVDALGQEGHPSTPVWFEREWKAYYKPFTGEWHQ